MVGDVLHFEDVESGLLDKLDFRLDRFQPFARDNVRLSVPLAFDTASKAFPAGYIEPLTDLRCLLSLTCQGQQAVVDFLSRDAARASALFGEAGALRRYEAIESERGDSFRHVETIQTSLSTKNTEIEWYRVHRESNKRKIDVLRHSRNATQKVSPLQSHISRSCKRSVVWADFVTRGCEAVVECSRSGVYRMCESVSADIKVAKLSVVESIELPLGGRMVGRVVTGLGGYSLG